MSNPNRMTEKERQRAKKWKIKLENQVNSTFYKAKRTRIRFRLCKKHKKFLDKIARLSADEYHWHSAPGKHVEIWLFVEEVLRVRLPYARSTYNGDIWADFISFFKRAKAAGLLRKRSI